MTIPFGWLKRPERGPSLLLSEDGNAVSHVYFDGSKLVDSKGVAWTTVGGGPTMVAASGLLPAGATGFSTTKHYKTTALNDVFDIGGDFAFAAVFKAGASLPAAERIVAPGWSSLNAGWSSSIVNTQHRFDTYGPAGALARTDSYYLTPNAVPYGGINIVCGGRNGTGQASIGNLARYETTASTQTTLKTDGATYIGIDAGNNFPMATSTLLEFVLLNGTPFTEALARAWANEVARKLTPTPGTPTFTDRGFTWSDVSSLFTRTVTIPGAPMATPIPYSGTNLTHTTVLYIPGGWNGHNWWLSMTPFTDGGEALENPSVYAADDAGDGAGGTWAAPTGGTNPVIAYKTGQFNCDTDLVNGGDGRLYLFYNAQDGSSRFQVVSSSDGVTWSPPIEIMSSVNVGGNRIVSPTVVWTGTQWMMFYWDMAAAKVKYSTASVITGPWSAGANLNIGNLAGGTVWHIQAKNIGGAIVLLAASLDKAQLRFAWSTDQGASFTWASSAVATGVGSGWATGLYRSTFEIVNRLGVNYLGVWISGVNGAAYRIGYAEIGP